MDSLVASGTISPFPESTLLLETGPAMLEVNPLRNAIKDYTDRTDVLRGYL